MIFVTGGNGLVGSFIVRKFLASGYRVRCLKRANSDISLLADVEENIDWVVGDILDIKTIESHLDGIEAIIHCAAIISFQKSRFHEMYQINVEGTRNIVNIALAKSIKTLGYISSIAAIGRSKQQTPIDETNMWVDTPSNSGYAKTKYMAELEVWRGMEEGLQGFIVNPSVILGSGNWYYGSTKLFKYAFDEHKFYPLGNINYVDVLDVAEIVYKLYVNNIFGERFILNAGNESYQTFLTKAAKSFGKTPPALKAGTLLSYLAYFLESCKHIITGKEPLLTIETLKMSRESYFYDNSKIKKTLDFEFRNLNESIEQISKDFKERYINK